MADEEKKEVSAEATGKTADEPESDLSSGVENLAIGPGASAKSVPVNDKGIISLLLTSK